MTGEDGRKKYFIDTKFTLYAGLFLIVIAVVIVLSRIPPKTYQNCDEIKKATGRSYIKENDPLYQRNLDVPYNGIACE